MHNSRDFMHHQISRIRMLRADTDNSDAPARRTTLAKIIREQAVGRQAELVAMLQKLGHAATQSSVSRDLRELGVAKLGVVMCCRSPAPPSRTIFPRSSSSSARS
jgi:hypothetical protein